SFSPTLAWRAVALPGGGAAIVHQRAVDFDVSIGQGGWGESGAQCADGVVHAAVTAFAHGAVAQAPPAIPGAVLPVDVAVARSGASFAVLAAGNAHCTRPQV